MPSECTPTGFVQYMQKKPPKSRHKSTRSLKNVGFKLISMYLCLPHFSTKGNYKSVLNWKAWKTMYAVVPCRQGHGVPLQVVHTNPDHVCLRLRASLRLKAAQPQTNSARPTRGSQATWHFFPHSGPLCLLWEARGTHLNTKQTFES